MKRDGVLRLTLASILVLSAHHFAARACWAQVAVAANQLVESNPLDLVPPVVAHEYRLDISGVADPRGVRVTAILQNSPTQRMRSTADPNRFSRMEVNDVISNVNGQFVKTMDELNAVLDAGSETAQLSLIDVNTNNTHQFSVRPVLIVSRSNRSQPQASTGARPKLYAVLIADTNDPKIGDGIKRSVSDVRQQLEKRILGQQLELIVLDGNHCTPAEIIYELGVIPSRSSDTILVYYFGHGAYDPRYEHGDPARGHFLELGNKDLLRQTIWRYLADAPAKLRVLVTDACNEKGSADPLQKYMFSQETREVAIKGATNLEWLLLGHSGELDLSAASRGQYAWYSNKGGGYFSSQWLALGDDHELSYWSPFLTELGSRTNQYYLQERGRLLAKPNELDPTTLSQLQAQQTMMPVTFRRNLVRDAQSPVDVNLNRIFQTTVTTKRVDE
ncbi:MAG: hypothetical protein WBD20_19730 [Pirellulaceae bacterium]